MTKVDHVDALFGGERIRFRVAAADLPSLEALLGGSAYQCFTKFAGGFWTLAELETVIAFAWPSPDGGERGAGIPADARLSVQRTLRSVPPGIYAALAMRILDAALFGLDETAACFDERAVEAA